MSFGRATAFAPASVGNVAVGFDILGFAVDALGDRVSVVRTARGGVTIADVRGVAGDLPREPEHNTAGRALLALRAALGLDFGFELSIDKGIPLCSGLGGSAASAVAAVVAANALLDEPRELLELLQFALEGEAVASGSLHADNVAPSLFGGLVLTAGLDPPRVARIPVPKGLRAVLAHPHLLVATKEARAILKRTVELSDFVQQTANLAGFLAGCYAGDLDLLRASFRDVVIEPQRAGLIPGFAEAQRAALEAGALGCSLSGAGPTLFAWSLEQDAQQVSAALYGGLRRRGFEVDRWIVPIESPGARVIERR